MAANQRGYRPVRGTLAVDKFFSCQRATFTPGEPGRALLAFLGAIAASNRPSAIAVQNSTLIRVCLSAMKANRIGRRSELIQPDMTLDVALYLGLVLLAAVLLMWHMPSARFRPKPHAATGTEIRWLTASISPTHRVVSSDPSLYVAAQLPGCCTLRRRS